MVVFRFCVASLLLAAVSLPAQAGLLLRLDASATTVNSGDDVTISMILEDDGSIVTAGGLFSGAARLLVNDGGTATATVDSSADIIGNGAFINIDTVPFDFAFPELAPAGFTNLAGISQDVDLFGAPVFPVGGEVFIASFVTTITGAPGSSVTLTSSSIGTTFTGIVGGDLTTIFDPAMNDSVTISIAGAHVIPEPSSILVWCLMIGTVVGFTQYRKRRRAEAIAAA